MVGTDAAGELNNIGLLFWIIYFLEKMLSLRNGRSSTVVDAEITLSLPRPGPSYDPNMMGCARNSIKIGGLAGRIYTELYCAESLSLPAVIRSQRATSLSQELNELSCEASAVNVLDTHSNLPICQTDQPANLTLHPGTMGQINLVLGRSNGHQVNADV
jgi:hypothetical protein